MRTEITTGATMTTSKFGKSVDALFCAGHPVSLASLTLANNVDMLEAKGGEVAHARSKLDEAFEAARNRKFQLDSLKVEVVPSNSPIDLDKITKPVPYSGRLERAHDEQLKRKFKLPNGLELVSQSKSESKAEGEKPMLESIGTSAESKVNVNFVTQRDIRW